MKIYCEALESKAGGFKKARSARPQPLGRAERTEKYVSRAKGRERRWRLFTTLPSRSFLLVLVMMAMAGMGRMTGSQTSAWASPDTETFQGFTKHISIQIGKDKQQFAVADTCTAWFYKQMGRKPRPEVEQIHFIPLNRKARDLDCASLFPEGLEQARRAFGDTQQHLSLSLTFFQMALIGDGDDDQQYSAGEIHDVLESFGLPFQSGQMLGRYQEILTSLFDTIRSEVKFQFLMEGMQTLMNKGYRFTEADQSALNQEASGSPR
jgi:hypothetical protein